MAIGKKAADDARRIMQLEEIKKQLPPDSGPHCIYRAYGKYASASSSTIKTHDQGINLGLGGNAKVTLKKGTLNGQEITYISKTWNGKKHWDQFYSELYLNAHPGLLRPLQGICVPEWVMAYRSGNDISFIMEPPHAEGWRSADIFMSGKIKSRIVAAYEKIHDQSVLHGDVSLRHMLVNDDEEVTIIDFAHAATAKEFPGMRKCTTEQLYLEMRKVKYILNYQDAARTERARTYNARKSGKPSKTTPPLSEEDMDLWDVEIISSMGEGPDELHFTIPPEMRSAPFMGDTDFERLPLWAELLREYILYRALYGGKFLCDEIDPSPGASSSRPQKRARNAESSDGDNLPAPKKVKTVRFHPDVNDNSHWFVQPKSNKTAKSSSPAPSEAEDVEAWPDSDAETTVAGPSSLYADADEIDKINRPGSSAFPHLVPDSPPPEEYRDIAPLPRQSASTRSATKESKGKSVMRNGVAEMPLSTPSIVLTGPDGKQKSWRVTNEAFENITMFIEYTTGQLHDVGVVSLPPLRKTYETRSRKRRADNDDNQAHASSSSSQVEGSRAAKRRR